jgi:hypothetical protein
MVSELQSEIHGKVFEYLHGRTGLAELENWLWPFLAALEDEDEDARNGAGVIGSLISEYSRGDRTEDSMLQEMATIIRPFAPPQQGYTDNSFDVVPFQAGSNSNFDSNFFTVAA